MHLLYFINYNYIPWFESSDLLFNEIQLSKLFPYAVWKQNFLFFIFIFCVFCLVGIVIMIKIEKGGIDIDRVLVLIQGTDLLPVLVQRG